MGISKKIEKTKKGGFEFSSYWAQKFPNRFETEHIYRLNYKVQAVDYGRKKSVESLYSFGSHVSTIVVYINILNKWEDRQWTKAAGLN